MNIDKRLQKLESTIKHIKIVEFAYREPHQSIEEAIALAKMKFSAADEFIVISWISPKFDFDG
jgi:hypothetical protein